MKANIRALRGQKYLSRQNPSTSTAKLCSSRVTNLYFDKPSQLSREINGYALRRAITEIKPCIDLRHVRRGRKVFSIPRIIPSFKRALFGVRELLSVLDRRTKNSFDKSEKKGDTLSRKKEKVRDKNIVTVNMHSDTAYLLSSRSFSEREAPSLLASRDITLASPSQNNLSTTIKNDTNSSFLLQKNKNMPYTRTTFHGRDKNKNRGPDLSLSASLGYEVKASSQSRSRVVDNKKRIYRVASANRGSIRMSWWL